MCTWKVTACPQAAQQKNGAPIFKNQAGILSNPAAECRNWSTISNIKISLYLEGGTKQGHSFYESEQDVVCTLSNSDIADDLE